MTYGIYTFRDNKTCFGQLWLDHNDDSATRGFGLMINNSDGIMGFNASDFDLFRVGSFDSDSGLITAEYVIKFICNGNAVKRSEFKSTDERTDNYEKS